jgi:hypothetical protein
VEPLDILNFSGGQLLIALPSLVGWTAVVVVGALLIRRGAGMPAALLLTGGALMLGAGVLHLPLALIPPFLTSRGWPLGSAAGVLSFLGLGLELVRLGAIVCLLCAFWKQFHVTEALRRTQ